MTAHASLSASSMHRWSACPGSVALIAQAPPAVSSVYAEEGSDAHAYAAFVLTRKDRNLNPNDVGQTIVFDGRTVSPSAEMQEAVKVYVDHVVGLGGERRIEHRFDLSAIHPGCFGTADYVAWLAETKTLHVVDYKHGAGVAVEAEGNPQLQYYALGALLNLGYKAEKVVITVVQPRCYHAKGPVRSWEIDALDLLGFGAELQAYARAAEAPDAPLHPGDHCRFCPAAAICPALEAKGKEIAAMEFGEIGKPIDYARLAQGLAVADLLEGRIKAMRELAYAEAERGAKIPGYKLVEKVPRRKWRDETEAAVALQAIAPEHQVFERSLRSPAQMEKALGAQHKAAIGALVVKESSGTALVPDGDKRPAINRGAGADFDLTAIPDFLKRN